MPAQASSATQPALPLAERALRPAAEELERRRRAERASGPACPHAEDEAAPDEEAAQGDDERRHPAVGHEEPLQEADRGPEQEAEGQRDDPDECLALQAVHGHVDAEEREDPVRLDSAIV